MKSFSLALALASVGWARPQFDAVAGLMPAIQEIGFEAMGQLVSGGDLSSSYTSGVLTPEKIGAFTKKLPPALLKQAATGFVQNVFNKGYGKNGALAIGINSTLPTRQAITPPRQDVKGSKSVKIRYGPYLVPGMPGPTPKGQKRVKKQIEDGTLWNYPDTNVEKPCANCVIVGMNAGLEDKNGKEINVDTGAWLHHFVLFNQGPGRVDATCTGKQSVPHFAVGTDPDHSERMFSSGNERTPAFLTKWAGQAGQELKPVGYHVNNVDSFHIVVDLMNDNRVDQAYWLTISYDYVDAADGHDLSTFDDMRPVWFDVDPCGISEVAPKKQSGSFDIDMPEPWVATIDGEILGYAGHLHDGGQWIDLEVNGKPICKSNAKYGETPAYHSNMDISMAAGMPMDSASSHISSMGVCVGPTIAKDLRYMKKGSSYNLKAFYDYDKNAGMKEMDDGGASAPGAHGHSGGQNPIMGIAIMYVRQPYVKRA